MTTAVEFSRDGHIGRITLNRPDAGNGIDAQMVQDLRAIGEALGEDRDLRAIILSGRGANFCVGGDIRVFSGLSAQGPSGLKNFIDGFHFFIRKLRAHPAPVVAAVNGAAAGGGLSLMLLADFAVATKSSKFAVAYRRIATSTDGGLSFFLPRAVGLRKAAELMLLRDAITAEEALAIGLVNKLVDDAALQDEALKMAQTLAANARHASANIKQLLNASMMDGLDAQLDRERDAFAACSQTADFQEGISAFLEKRPAKYS